MSGYKDLETGVARGAGALMNEVLGTFFLSLALLADLSDWGALAVGMMFGLFVWWEPDGHYNAAITLSTCVGKKPSMGLMAGIKCVSSQVVGATLAVLLSGFFQNGSVSVADGSYASGLSDALLMLVLLFTFAKNHNGLDLGLAYYSGLSAFPSALGANVSVVLGVCLGNLLLGNGLDLGMNLAWAVGAPLVAGVVVPLLDDPLGKVPRGGELFGTFLFALLTFSIGFDNTFAVGASLHTVSNIFTGVYNPAVTLATWARGGFDLSIAADPLFDFVAQIVGTVLAALTVSALGTTPALPDAAALGPAAVLEFIFTLVFVLTYICGAATLTKGLAYFAVTTAFTSSFNAAFVLGTYLAGLLGASSDASLGLTSLIDPLAAGLVAGLLYHKGAGSNVFPYHAFNEAVGTFLLFLFVGSTSSRLAVGAAVLTLHTICGGGVFNPALTLAQSGVDLKTFLLQLLGAIAAGLAATYAGVADGASTSVGGLSDGGTSLVAEALLAVLLVKTYDRNGNDHLSTGLSYFALLAALGAAAGSMANPALVLGNWVGTGLLGDGFDVGIESLIGLVGHLAAPLVGAALANRLIALPHKLMLEKISLSADEFFGSFLAVLAASGVAASGATSAELAYGLVLMTIYNLLPPSTDLFPAVSAYRELGGDKSLLTGGVRFLQKLAAQLLGALAAGLAASWLFSDSGAGDGSDGLTSRRRLGIDLPPALLNGLLLGLSFALGVHVCKSTLHLGLTFFASASVFSGVDINGARTLATALVATLTGEGFDFATDLSGWTALVAPIVGGILAGYLPRLLGK